MLTQCINSKTKMYYMSNWTWTFSNLVDRVLFKKVKVTDHSYHSQGLHSGQCAGMTPDLPWFRLLRFLQWQILHQKRFIFSCDYCWRHNAVCTTCLNDQPICTCMLMIRCRSPLVKACPTSSACSLWIKRFSSERSRWQRFSSGRKYQGSKFF